MLSNIVLLNFIKYNTKYNTEIHVLDHSTNVLWYSSGYYNTPLETKELNKVLKSFVLHAIISPTKPRFSWANKYLATDTNTGAIQ